MDEDILRVLNQGSLDDPSVADELEALKAEKDEAYKRDFVDAAASVHRDDPSEALDASKEWLEEYAEPDFDESYRHVMQVLHGVSLRDDWRYRDAIEVFQSVPDWESNADIVFQIADCRLRMGDFRSAGRLAEAAAMLGGGGAWGAIGSRARRFLELARRYVDAERRYFDQPEARTDVMLFPRGWSSTSPFVTSALPGISRPVTGGGYFLSWRNHGVAIDPGLDFLRNYHDLGGPFSITDIDTVLVSHCHLDHVADLPAIASLVYDSGDYLDERTSVDLYADPNTISDYSGIVAQSLSVHDVESSAPLDLDDITVYPFNVQHSISPCFGFRFELEAGPTIGYTADTGYFGELASSLRGSDIVIAHYSKQYAHDADDELSEKHLGLYGLERLIGDLDPEVFLIGEWSANQGDRRGQVVDLLRERTGVREIHPIDRTLSIKLENCTISCTGCGVDVDPVDVSGSPANWFDEWPYLCRSCC